MAPRGINQHGDTALSKSRGTGFEDGYADPPVTPEEHKDEKAIYAPNIPFHERIEECIQRYRARRRMGSDRMNLFTKFLLLGGIDATQRQFTGTAKLKNSDLKEEGFNSNEIRGMYANDVLTRGGGPVSRFYNSDFPQHWEVDFAGVVAGFLSDYLPSLMGTETDVVKIGIEGIMNFLKYIRHHDVCPEYEENLAKACAICKDALLELPKCAAVNKAMPGDFNLAARILLCGTGEAHEVDFVTDDNEDVVCYPEKKEFAFGFDSSILARRDLDPTLIFKATIAIYHPEHLEAVLNMDKEPIRVVNTYQGNFEARGLFPTNEAQKKAFAGIKGSDGKTGAVGAVGILYVAPITIEDGWDNHPTLAESPEGSLGSAFPLLVDDNILSKIKAESEPGKGTKFRLVVCETNLLDKDTGAGIKFIKQCTQTLASFYTFLPQSLMLDYKVPRPNERPAPSTEDPFAEERNAQYEVEDEERAAKKLLKKEQRELGEMGEELEKTYL